MSKKKILVIDDDPGVVRLNNSLLKSEGYDVISASDGLEGILKAQKESPDAIFLDLILPEMHGYEVCKKLKSDETTKSIPIIIVTATGLEDIAEIESEINADAYLAKPYNITKIKEVLVKIFD